MNMYVVYIDVYICIMNVDIYTYTYIFAYSRATPWSVCVCTNK